VELWKTPCFPRAAVVAQQIHSSSEVRVTTHRFCRRLDPPLLTHMVVDVPVGGFESGGVDSSSVIRFASKAPIWRSPSAEPGVRSKRHRDHEYAGIVGTPAGGLVSATRFSVMTWSARDAFLRYALFTRILSGKSPHWTKWLTFPKAYSSEHTPLTSIVLNQRRLARKHPMCIVR